MLYADDARTVSRSPRGLRQMMAVFVEVFGTFGLTISESESETMCMPILRAPATKIVFKWKLCDRPKARLLPLKARMVRSEVVEAFLHGCAT